MDLQQVVSMAADTIGLSPQWTVGLVGAGGLWVVKKLGWWVWNRHNKPLTRCDLADHIITALSRDGWKLGTKGQGIYRHKGDPKNNIKAFYINPIEKVVDVEHVYVGDHLAKWEKKEIFAKVAKIKAKLVTEAAETERLRVTTLAKANAVAS